MISIMLFFFYFSIKYEKVSHNYDALLAFVHLSKLETLYGEVLFYFLQNYDLHIFIADSLFM